MKTDQFAAAVERYQLQLEEELAGKPLAEMLRQLPLKSQYYFGVDEKGGQAIRFFKSSYLTEEMRDNISLLYKTHR